jgi:hypothetical protein
VSSGEREYIIVEMMIFPEQPPSKDASGFDVVVCDDGVVDYGDDEITKMTSLFRRTR